MNESVISAFWLGLLGGVHCLGMCGAVVGVLTSNLSTTITKNPAKILIYQLTYNMGRIISYVLMGIIFASFASLLIKFNATSMSFFDFILRIFSAIVMIFAGLFIMGKNSFIQVIEKAGQKLWVKIQPISNRFLPIKNLKDALFFGILWGGIPCGLVYSALALALSSANVTEGAAIMLAFGIGTLPSLLAMAGFAMSLIRFMRLKIVKTIAGIMIILLGVWSLSMPIKMLVNKDMKMNNKISVNFNYYNNYLT